MQASRLRLQFIRKSKSTFLLAICHLPANAEYGFLTAHLDNNLHQEIAMILNMRFQRARC